MGEYAADVLRINVSGEKGTIKMREKIIELQNITKTYDNGFTAVSDFNLYVKRGEFITFLGPSGCGKTTTLRMIAGFELPTEGKILLNGKKFF